MVATRTVFSTQLLPKFAETLVVALFDVRDEHLAHDPVVGDLGFAQTFDPVPGQADEEAAPVVRVDAALEQAELGEAIDRSRDEPTPVVRAR